MEGTSSLGAGLARWLRSHGHSVLEVNRPYRQTRRGAGKSDPVDAEAAARAVQAGTALGSPKSGDGRVEMIRALRVARRSAVRARTQSANHLHALVVTAPDELRSTVRRLGIAALVATVSQWRPGTCPDTPLATTRFAMKSIALRCQEEPTATASTEAACGHGEANCALYLLAINRMAWECGPGSTSLAGPPLARPRPRSSAASNATSHERSTAPSRTCHRCPSLPQTSLDSYKSLAKQR
jgi:hypothetical protein